MTSQLFKEKSKLKGLSGVKTKQGRDVLNVRKVTTRCREEKVVYEGGVTCLPLSFHWHLACTV